MNTAEFLGLRSTHNPHRWYLPVEPGICVPIGFLFGGAGLAAAVSALESTTGRPLVWATAQYLSYARPPAIMDVDVTVPVVGNHVTQARAIGKVGDREILTVNAALGKRDLDIESQWATPLEVPPPSECPPVPKLPNSDTAIHGRFELRIAAGSYGPRSDRKPSADGRSALWVRVPEGLETSAATLAIIADWMPSGIGQALGRWAGGNSLDNTIRILNPVPTAWVLCDIQIHGIRSGFGHGLIHLWSQDGILLATGSQSLIVRLFE